MTDTSDSDSQSIRMNPTVLLWALEGVGLCLQGQMSKCCSWLSEYKEFCPVFFISASSKTQIIWIKCWDRKNTFDEILPGRELNQSGKWQTLSIIQAIRGGNTNNDRSTREIQAVFWGTWTLSPCHKKSCDVKWISQWKNLSWRYFCIFKGQMVFY